MLILARLERPGHAPADRRGAARLVLRLGTSLGSSDSEAIIRDISKTGLQFETPAGLEIGDTVEVDLPEVGARRAIVVWRKLRLVGCRFNEPISAGAVSAVLLRGDPAAGSRVGHEDASDPEKVADFAAPLQGSGRGRLRALIVPALILGALLFGAAALIFSMGFSAVAVLAAGLAAVFGFLVMWGLWILDNTRGF